jgi:hypothetical protein
MEKPQRIGWFRTKKKAEILLHSLIHRWKVDYKDHKTFQKAVKVLHRQKAYLLTFFQHVAIPVSTQSIESDHSQLKQLWRLSSGVKDKPYTLVYHGNSTSLTRNTLATTDGLSPLELLGFSPDKISHWILTCSKENYFKAKSEMAKLREPRKIKLRTKQRSLSEQFKESFHHFLEWLTKKFELD